MNDDSKRPTFDIAKALQPLIVDVPILGELQIDVRSAGFLEWLEAGDKAQRWREPSAFVRDAIVERGTFGGEKDRKPDTASVAALGPDELEEAAERIIAATGRLFAPRQAVDAKTGKLRPYREDDPDPLEPIGDEAQSTRLLRLARNYLGYYQAMSRRLVEEMKGARGILDLAARADTLASVTRSQKLLDDISGASLQRRLGILQRPAALQALDLAIRAPLIEHHRLLAGQLASRESPLARIRDSLDGMLGLKALGALGERARPFADIASWPRALDRYYGLDLSRGLPGRDAGGSLAGRALAEAASLLRPGYQSVAMLGMEGIAARGAAADLLRLYDEIPDEEAEAFASVVAGVTALDADEADPAEMATALERAWFVISRALGFVKDEVHKAGLIAMLALLVAVHSDWVAMNPPAQDNGSLAARLDEATRELKGMRQDFRNRGEAGARNPIRYVHGIARLRAEPNRGAQLIRLIYPDQLLRVIEREGDWVKVEAFDYPTDTPVRGWIHRGNLRRAPLS